MAIPKLVVAQRNFSGGQIDPRLKRNEDEPSYKSGGRQCLNFRLLNAQGLSNRFGRSAKFFDGPRVEEILMGPGQPFMLCFSAGVSAGSGKITIRQMDGTLITSFNSFPWTVANVGQIVWCILQTQIFICFPGMQPRVISWVPNTTTFTIALYAELMNGNQIRTAFYRISQHDITLQPSGVGKHGDPITLTASSPVFDPAQVGTYIRYIGREIQITAVPAGGGGTPGTLYATATGSVIETLYTSFSLITDGNPDVRTIVNIGDVIIGSTSGSQLYVTQLVSSTTIIGQSINGIMPAVGGGTGVGDHQVGPGGDLGVPQNGSARRAGPEPVPLWDEQVFNVYRGWPASCFADQQRLGFCNIPRVPSAIIWSAIGSPFDLYIPSQGLTPSNSIFELAPGKTQVYFVLAGAESDEFVFGDNAVYWIPINVQNPLSATGSVVMNKIDEGAAQVQPRFQRGAIIYVNAAANMMKAICATGAYNRPYESRGISEFHQGLFLQPQVIAAPDGDSPLFSERYIYVLNSNGTYVVGKAEIENGQIKEPPGWTPTNGVGTVTWIAARLGTVTFTTTYPGSTQGTLVEVLDPLRFMDASINYNSPPAALAPPGGKGPLWWAPGQPVQVIDSGMRPMGVYQVDSNGFLVPQFIGGEDLTSSQLVVGQMWTAVYEPFMPSPGPGQDSKQRMLRRRIARMSVYFIGSSGFVFARMYSGPVTPLAPPLGTIMNTRRIPAYVMGDDATQSAPLREGAEFWRPAGRTYDPRVAVIKDTVGPLTILELGAEISV